MRYNCGDCGDAEHACMAWDGRGYAKEGTTPNHNLMKECPPDIKECEYRIKKTASKPIKV